jgi:WD40 repeat protein
MNKFDNENLLKLIFSSLFLYKCNVIFNKIKNSTIGQSLLHFLKYENIFHSLGKKTTTLNKNIGKIFYFTILDNGDIVTETLQNRGLIKFWRQETFENYKTLDIGFAICFMLVHANRNLIFVGYENIKIFDNVDNLNCITSLEIGKDILDVEILVKRFLAVIITTDNFFQNNIIIYDPENNYNCIKIIEFGEDRPRFIVNLNDGRISVGLEQNIIKVYDICKSFYCLKVLEFDKTHLYSMLFISTSNLLLAGCYEGYINAWSSKDFCFLKQFTAHDIPVLRLSVLSSGYFASSTNHEIKIWDTKNFSCINILPKRNFKISLFIILKDKRFVSVKDDNTLVCWEY